MALVGLRWPQSHPERSREMLSSASIYTFGMTSQFLLVETWKQMVCIMVYRCIIQIAMGQIKSWDSCIQFVDMTCWVLGYCEIMPMVENGHRIRMQRIGMRYANL